MSARHSPATGSRSRSIRLEPVEADGASLTVAKADGTGERALTGPLEPFSMSWSPRSDAIALIAVGHPAGDRVAVGRLERTPGVERREHLHARRTAWARSNGGLRPATSWSSRASIYDPFRACASTASMP